MSFDFIRGNQPPPNLWTDRPRGGEESALDSESAVTLACHVVGAFERATSWAGLLSALAARGFALEFQGDRLILVNDETDVALCTCRFLGHGVADLTARLGKPRVLAPSGRLVAEIA